MIEFMIDRRLYFGLTPLASQRSQNSSANEGLRKTPWASKGLTIQLFAAELIHVRGQIVQFAREPRRRIRCSSDA